MKNKYIFEDARFFISEAGNGIVSSDLVFVSKFVNDKLQWNRGYKPDKISREFLRTLI